MTRLYSRIMQMLTASAHLIWQTLALYLALTIFLLARILFFIPDTGQQLARHLDWGTSQVAGWGVLTLMPAIVALALARRDQFTPAARLLVGLLIAEAALFLLRDRGESLWGWAHLWAGVSLGSYVLARQESAVALVAGLVAFTAGYFTHFGDLTTGAQTNHLVFYAGLVIWTCALAGITMAAAQSSTIAAETRLRQETADHLIAIGNQVAQALFARTPLDTVLPTIASKIGLAFPILNYVQIYLIDPNKRRAVLRASTGSMGPQLLEQELELPVGGLSAVGRVALSGKYLLIPDYTTNQIHRPPIQLSDIRAELAIPFVVNGEIIGALDLLSQQARAFAPVHIELFQAIAKQIAILIDGLGLYETAQHNIRENEALYRQTQTSLREIERLNYQLTGRAWSEYLRLQGGATGITVELDNGNMTPVAEWSPVLENARDQRQIVTDEVDDRKVVALPIIVRNEVIGAVEFEIESDSDLPDTALDLITAVGQRLGLALENRRLFDETQRAAQREVLINDIGKNLQGANSVEAIVQRAAQHLQEALTAQQVTIQLGTMERDQTAEETKA